MRNVTEELPEKNCVVVAYCKSGGMYIARYEKVLTWTGWKFKFINLMSNGLWHNDVIGWNRLPKFTETI
jgi:hypothetical protein